MRYFFSIILLSYLITSCSLASVSPDNTPTTHSGTTSSEIPKEARYLSGYDYPAIPLDELGK